jgi:transcription elongation factor GreA
LPNIQHESKGVPVFYEDRPEFFFFHFLRKKKNIINEKKGDFTMAVTYMTEEGFRKLKEELAYMESVQRPEISRQIAEARDKGDLSENAEYDAAKEAQGMLEAKIAQLKGLIASARLIDEGSIGTDFVQIMNKVTIRNLKTKKDMTYTLVSESEADLKSGKIAVNTPIAQGLLGKKVGDVVEIQVPSGTLTFEILEISI